VSRDAEVSTDSILLPLTLRSGILRNTACSVKAGSMSRSSRHDATLSRSRIVGGVVCGAILCEENSDSRPARINHLGCSQICSADPIRGVERTGRTTLDNLDPSMTNPSKGSEESEGHTALRNATLITGHRFVFFPLIKIPCYQEVRNISLCRLDSSLAVPSSSISPIQAMLNGFDPGYAFRHPVFFITYILAVPAWIIAFAAQCAAEAKYSEFLKTDNAHSQVLPTIHLWSSTFGIAYGSNCERSLGTS
jgi:hypothetical protein